MRGIAIAIALTACVDSTVPALRVTSLEIHGGSGNLLVLLRGHTLQLTAVAKDLAGNVVSNPSLVWTAAAQSGDTAPGQAQVSETGLVTGVARGWVEITACATYGACASRPLYVRMPVASLSFDADSLHIVPSGAVQLHITLADANGQRFPYEVLPEIPITVSSEQPSVATVDSSLVVLGVAPGQTNIIAGADSVTTTLPLRVQYATMVRISAGRDFACGLTADGAALCWGTTTRRSWERSLHITASARHTSTARRARAPCPCSCRAGAHSVR